MRGARASRGSGIAGAVALALGGGCGARHGADGAAPATTATTTAAPAPPTVPVAASDPPPAPRQDGGTWLCGHDRWEDCQARCDAGNALSCARYGLQLFYGGVRLHDDARLEVDRKAARIALGRACDLGYAYGCAELALIVGGELDQEFDDDHRGDLGGPVDPAAAQALERRACAGEVAMACAALAQHATGAEAARLTARACALGDAEACIDQGGARDDDDLRGALADFHRAMTGAPVASKLAAARVTCAQGTVAVATTSGVGGLGGPETYCAAPDGKREGTYRAWLSAEDLAEGAPHGVMSEETTYRADRKDGPHRRWHDNGQLREEGAFAADRETGPWTFYDDDGGVDAQGSYVDGARDGEWREGGIGGTWTGRYAHGAKDGAWTQRDAGGAVFEVTHYADGKKDGDDTRTWPDGQRCVDHWAHDLPTGTSTCWGPHGHKILERPYQGGQLDGVERTWDADTGALSTQGAWRAGKRQGVWTWYYSSGRKMRETTYRDDEDVGPTTEWDERGRKQ